MSGTVVGTYPLFTPDQLTAAQANMQEATDSVGTTGQFLGPDSKGNVSTGYIDATCDGTPFYVFSAASAGYVKAIAALGAGYRILQKPMNSSSSIVEARHQYLAFINDVLVNVLGLTPFKLNFLKTAFVFNQG